MKNTYKKNLPSKILSLLAFSLLLTACNNSYTKVLETPADPIEGRWLAEGQFEDGFAWYVEYEFKGGKYNMHGYPSVQESGTYQFLEQDANYYVLELKSGEAVETHEMVVNEDLLEWGEKDFKRIE